ncbi:MAG: hypothetical protein U0271_38295 [Polyangiaceae bacterium]
MTRRMGLGVALAALSAAGALGCGSATAVSTTPAESSQTDGGPPVCDPVAACSSSCGPRETRAAGVCRRFRPLASSEAHSCAIRPEGIACWGGDVGQGIFSRSPRRLSPTPFLALEFSPGDPKAVAVAVSKSFGCTLLENGRVRCWSAEASAELEGFARVIDLAIHESVLCAVLQSGGVQCADLKTPAPNLEDSNPVVRFAHPAPFAIPPLADVAAMVAGGEQFCALHRSGEVSCFQHGSRGGGRQPPPDPAATVLTGLSDAVDLALDGRRGYCAVRKTGAIVCNWGHPSPRGDGTRVNPLSLIEDAVELTVGQQHGCAIRRPRSLDHGNVVCWGDQMSSGPAVTLVDDLSDAVAVSAGNGSSCALRKDGSVYCWGDSSQGRLGNGVQKEVLRPTLVPGLSPALQVHVTENGACALTSEDVICWNSPNPTLSDTTGPAPAPRSLLRAVGRRFQAGTRFVQVDATCLLDDSGAFRCVDPAYDNSVTYPLSLEHVVDTVSVGNSPGYGVGLLDSGRVVFYSGGDQLEVAEIVKVDGLTNIQSIAGAKDIACAVEKDLSVKCFAYGVEDANELHLTSKVQTVPGVGVHSIFYDGGATFCGLTSIGEIVCFEASKDRNGWGRKSSRGLEIGAARNVAGVSGAVELALSPRTSCARILDGTVRCWGDNSTGLLGLGDLDPHPGSYPIEGLNEVVSIGVARGTACVARKNGEVLCWGSNADGRAGNRGQTVFLEPVETLGPIGVSRR